MISIRLFLLQYKVIVLSKLYDIFSRTVSQSPEKLKKVKAQLKLCNKLVNNDYNRFTNGSICNNLYKNNKVTRGRGGGSITNDAIVNCYAQASFSVFTVDDSIQPLCNKVADNQSEGITNNARGVLKLVRGLDTKNGPGPVLLSGSLLNFLALYTYI